MNVKYKSSFKYSHLLYLKCPLFPVFHFFLLALFQQRCAAFLNSHCHVSFLFVCSALWWLYYYYSWVSKSWQDWKDTTTTKAVAETAEAAGLSVQYVEWHLHFKRGRWNKPLVPPHPLSPSPPLCISLWQPVSLFLHSQSFITRHTLSIISWYQVWYLGSNRKQEQMKLAWLCPKVTKSSYHSF